MVPSTRWTSLLAALHENIARNNWTASIGDGRGVLTSAARLKYFYKASHDHVYMLNKKSARTVMQQITRIFNFEV